MTFDEFVKKYNGVATDYDGGYGVQCVDLAKLYMDKVLGISPKAIGNAEAYWNQYWLHNELKDNFDKIANTPSFVPKKGDIVVWGTKLSKWGHIAIANGNGDTRHFETYDQNWNGEAMHLVNHSYNAVEGVLRPKNQEAVNGKSKKSLEKNMTELIDIRLYFELYSDLQKAFGYNIEALTTHLVEFGIKEGRIFSIVFNVNYYKGLYSDLSKMSNIEAFKHFVNYGIKEGRRGSEFFDIQYYKNYYSDLKNLSNHDLIIHFINNGIKEGRRGSNSFDVQHYRNTYSDLQKAFNNDFWKYFKHYIQYGKSEKRKTI